MALDFDRLRSVNVARCRRWHNEGLNYLNRAVEIIGGRDVWSGADWSNAAAGEMGEAANVVKKLRRAESGTPGAPEPDYDTLRSMLGDEIADTVIYLDLLATYYEIDLGDAVVRKFDAVSEREGLPERLGSPVPEARSDE